MGDLSRQDYRRYELVSDKVWRRDAEFERPQIFSVLHQIADFLEDAGYLAAVRALKEDAKRSGIEIDTSEWRAANEGYHYITLMDMWWNVGAAVPQMPRFSDDEEMVDDEAEETSDDSSSEHSESGDDLEEFATKANLKRKRGDPGDSSTDSSDGESRVTSDSVMVDVVREDGESSESSSDNKQPLQKRLKVDKEEQESESEDSSDSDSSSSEDEEEPATSKQIAMDLEPAASVSSKSVSSDSESSSDSDDNSSSSSNSDSESEEEHAANPPAPFPKKVKKTKPASTPLPESESDSSGEGESEDEEAGEEAAPLPPSPKKSIKVKPAAILLPVSDDDSFSESESEDEVAKKDLPLPPLPPSPPKSSMNIKKTKHIPPPPKRSIDTNNARPLTAKDLPYGDSDSSSGDGSDSENDALAKVPLPPSPSTKSKATAGSDASDSDSLNESSSDSESKSEDEPAPPPPKKSKKSQKTKVKPSKTVLATEGKSASESSATLLPDSPIVLIPYTKDTATHALLIDDTKAGASSAAKHSTATEKKAKNSKKEQVPFSRIPTNQKVDPKFASNAYVSYDYADRAHRDLIVTKGKGFTKEKNKKKRGKSSARTKLSGKDVYPWAYSPEEHEYSPPPDMFDDNPLAFKEDTWAFMSGCGFNPMSGGW